ncbi:MAG: acetyl-CoA hydrolase/transferase family protein, partial [Deltaproteobacteria bacterium]|nr:acetyl-CoA hydrolase/transferase family protein [Deltaproteobacteria bacterium]
MPVAERRKSCLEQLRNDCPEKFSATARVFRQIHRGDRIFIGTACAEPQHLVQSLTDYVGTHPKAIIDAEVFHVWTLGVAPYADEKFKRNFRLNSFFVGTNSRDAVNCGLADYSPVFLSQVPALFERGIERLDVALIQTSLPDKLGYVSLGISVDIVKAAVENARLVIAQVNAFMPRVHGDTFIHVSDIDYLVPHDEPLLKYTAKVPDTIARKIGTYVARIIQDGDTIQVGYGSMPNAILASLDHKKHLGIHTELLSDGIVDLIQKGVIDNSKKTLDRGKTVASFCMGTPETYRFIHDNPAIEFRAIDYTNNPRTIAQQANMTAINSALQIDLTGQSSSESIGKYMYSGIGGHADFMRSTPLAPGGKTILTLRSTSNDGEHSRIVALLPEGAGTSLTRGDIHYVVTEYGIVHLHGKNIRQRAMDLIAIAHPKFRPALVEEAKKQGLIYKDQAFIPGRRGEYPETLETYRTTKADLSLLLRPVKISDEPLVKDFFYALSDRSMFRRFISKRQDMPHERLQEFVVIDYTAE